MYSAARRATAVPRPQTPPAAALPAAGQGGGRGAERRAAGGAAAAAGGAGGREAAGVRLPGPPLSSTCVTERLRASCSPLPHSHSGPAPPARLPQAAALEAEQQALYAENQALNKAQAALSGEVRGLKQDANALTDEASQLRYRLSQAKGQTELLRGQIVQSPQKIQALLRELAAAVERERAMVADAGARRRGRGGCCVGRRVQGHSLPAPMCVRARVPGPLLPSRPADRRSRDLGGRLDVVGKVEKEVAKASGLMEGVEAEIGRKKEVSRRVGSGAAGGGGRRQLGWAWRALGRGGGATWPCCGAVRRRRRQGPHVPLPLCRRRSKRCTARLRERSTRRSSWRRSTST